MGHFEGKTVLVTGGAGGQGASHVRAYHRHGANVVVAGISEDESLRLVDELGDGAAFAKIDVADESDWTTAVAAVSNCSDRSRSW